MERFDCTKMGAMQRVDWDGKWVRYDDHRAEIERLEKEVEALKTARDMLGRFWDKAKQEADTAWNDAIEEAVNLLDFDDACVDGYVKLWAKDRIESILALKRPTP